MRANTFTYGTQARVYVQFFRTCSSTTAVETYGPHMGNIWGALVIPICSPYVPHMFDIWGKFQKQPNHLWPICCLTYGETYGLRNNIWGNVVIFAFKLAFLNIWAAYGEHIGNIWETYGEHMGNIWGTYGKHMGNIWGAHQKQYPTKSLPSPAAAAPSRTVRLPPSLF